MTPTYESPCGKVKLCGELLAMIFGDGGHMEASVGDIYKLRDMAADKWHGNTRIAKAARAWAAARHERDALPPVWSIQAVHAAAKVQEAEEALIGAIDARPERAVQDNEGS